MAEFANLQEGLSYVLEPIIGFLLVLTIVGFTMEAIWTVVLFAAMRMRRKLA